MNVLFSNLFLKKQTKYLIFHFLCKDQKQYWVNITISQSHSIQISAMKQLKIPSIAVQNCIVLLGDLALFCLVALFRVHSDQGGSEKLEKIKKIREILETLEV